MQVAWVDFCCWGFFSFLWWIDVVTPQVKMDKPPDVLSKKQDNFNQDL